MQKKQQKQIVRLPNDFVEAIYSLQADTKKVFLSLCLHLNDKNKIKLHISQIEREVGIKIEHLNQSHLKKILKEMMSKIIEIKDIKKRNKWKLVALVKEVEYNEGILTAEISRALLPYFKLAQERLFTRFNIQNIKPLTSIHAIRIYELAKQYDDTGWREMELDEFKKMLQLGGKYDRVFDLKRRVLEVAKKQINANTDINIDYELIKEGRSYKKLRLKIATKDRKEETKELKVSSQKPLQLARLEKVLNRRYRKKSLKDKRGLRWFVTNIEVLNEEEAKITLTDLSKETKITKKIKELPQIFNKEQE